MKKIASSSKLNSSAILNNTNANSDFNTKNISNSRVIKINPKSQNDIKDRLKTNLNNELADQFKKK